MGTNVLNVQDIFLTCIPNVCLLVQMLLLNVTNIFVNNSEFIDDRNSSNSH